VPESKETLEDSRRDAGDKQAPLSASGLSGHQIEAGVETLPTPEVLGLQTVGRSLPSIAQLERSRSTPSRSAASIPAPAASLVRWQSAEASFAGQALLEAGQHCFTELTLVRLTSDTARRASSVPRALEEADSVMTLGQDPSGRLATGPVPCTELGRLVGCCSICREEPPGGAADLFVPDRLCSHRPCSVAICRACLTRYYTSCIEASRYAVPFIRCPGCRGYVRSTSWAGCVDARVVLTMEESARHLLSLRCVECDQPGTLLVARAEATQRPRLLGEALGSLSAEERARLLAWWPRYAAGEEDALAGLALLAAGLQSADGVPPPELKRRVDGLLGLVDDCARRAVLQLAFLRRWPKMWSRCCNAAHCFKCKVGSHHEGVTCDEVQRRQMQDSTPQFCPGCGVATVKTEGCNSMICICGEEWTWEGEELWVDDWLDQDDDDEDAEDEDGAVHARGNGLT